MTLVQSLAFETVRPMFEDDDDVGSHCFTERGRVASVGAQAKPTSNSSADETRRHIATNYQPLRRQLRRSIDRARAKHRNCVLSMYIWNFGNLSV